METYSSILAWESPWTEKPGRLQSLKFGVGHDCANEQTHLQSINEAHRVLTCVCSIKITL